MHCAKVFPVDFEHVIVGFSCIVCETQNLLTLQYIVYLEILSEESCIIQKLFICNAMQVN